jgi:hypothetical protein
MNHIEAMRQMVAELEYVLDCINNEEIPFDGDDFHEALRLGRQAIAEAERQKGWVLREVFYSDDGIPIDDREPQRQWVGLTDEETQTCWDKAVNTIAPQYSIVRAIEAKLKEKNT